VGATALVTRSVVTQWAEISATVGEGVDQLADDGGETLGLDDEATAQVEDEGKDLWSGASDVLVEGVLRVVPVAAEVATTVALAVFILFFFLKDGRAMWAWVLDRVPIDRELADGIGWASWQVLASYLRGMAVVAAVDAAAIGLGLVVLGVPFVGAIVVLTFFAAFIPTVGAVLAGGVAVFIALADGGWGMAVATLVVVLLVQQLESNLLQPIIVGRATRLHPLVVFLAITAGAILGGVVGMLLAVPLTAVAVTVTSQLRTAGVFAED
jgi:putative heme transporter